MTSREFAYWLQGFFEVAEPKELNTKQVELIKKHLNLVFYHEIDPSYTPDPTKQEEMNQIHNTPVYPSKPEDFFHHNDPLARC